MQIQTLANTSWCRGPSRFCAKLIVLLLEFKRVKLCTVGLLHTLYAFCYLVCTSGHSVFPSLDRLLEADRPCRLGYQYPYTSTLGIQDILNTKG